MRLATTLESEVSSLDLDIDNLGGRVQTQNSK